MKTDTYDTTDIETVIKKFNNMSYARALVMDGTAVWGYGSRLAFVECLKWGQDEGLIDKATDYNTEFPAGSYVGKARALTNEKLNKYL